MYLVYCQWPRQMSIRWLWSSRCRPTRRNPPIGQSQIGKARDHRSLNGVCFCCAFTCLLLLSFPNIWHGVNGYGETPTAYSVVGLSHGNIPFYWAFSPVDCHWKWFLTKLYYLIDNNNVNFYRILMNKNKYKEMLHSQGLWVWPKKLHRSQLKLMIKPGWLKFL